MFLLKWLIISCLVGAVTGSASAWFLISLDFVTHFRENHPQLIYLLPFAGLVIASIYHRYGRNVESGNNLLIDEVHEPKDTIPLRMTPLVLLGTLLTHLFGGSAGREGTAVQMGGSLADQATKLLRLDSEERKILIMAGISGGFASVFGTPLAGAVFGLEVLAIGRVRYQALLPCFVTALAANFICLLWGVHHTPFPQIIVPDQSLMTWIFVGICGVAFGLCAQLFVRGGDHLDAFLQKALNNPYLRIFVGGSLIVLLTLALGTHRYLGLGVPVIVESFYTPSVSYDFLLKIIFTLITLCAGFKGGEVTPLFFIGATLGSTLSTFLPLPTSLLTAMGLTAVFAGAANTPLACILMGMELFGSAASPYLGLAVILSYLCSGHRGIYHSQKIEVRKYA